MNILLCASFGDTDFTPLLRTSSEAIKNHGFMSISLCLPNETAGHLGASSVNLHHTTMHHVTSCRMTGIFYVLLR